MRPKLHKKNILWTIFSKIYLCAAAVALEAAAAPVVVQLV
jgi:hypothetical protein